MRPGTRTADITVLWYQAASPMPTIRRWRLSVFSIAHRRDAVNGCQCLHRHLLTALRRQHGRPLRLSSLSIGKFNLKIRDFIWCLTKHYHSFDCCKSAISQYFRDITQHFPTLKIVKNKVPGYGCFTIETDTKSSSRKGMGNISGRHKGNPFGDYPRLGSTILPLKNKEFFIFLLQIYIHLKQP